MPGCKLYAVFRARIWISSASIAVAISYATQPAFGTVNPEDRSVYEIVSLDFPEASKSLLRLVYSSRLAKQGNIGLFGLGWCSDLDTHLVDSGEDMILHRCKGGRKEVVSKIEKTTGLKAYPAYTSTGAGFSVILNPGETLGFNFSGRLESIERLGLPTIRLKYDASGKLGQVQIGTQIYIVTTTQDRNTVSSISIDGDHPFYQFQQREDRLISIHHRGKIDSFTYFKSGLIESRNSGSLAIRYTYDSFNRAVEVKDSNHQCVEKIRQVSETRLSSSIAVEEVCRGMQAISTVYRHDRDSEGHLTRQYDQFGRLILMQRRDLLSFRLLERQDSRGYVRLKRKNGVVTEVEQDGLRLQFVRRQNKIAQINKSALIGRRAVATESVLIQRQGHELSLVSENDAASVIYDSKSRVLTIKDHHTGYEVSYTYQPYSDEVKGLKINQIEISQYLSLHSISDINRLLKWSYYLSLIESYSFT